MSEMSQDCHINVTDSPALKAAIARSLLKSQVVRSSEAPPVTVATTVNDKGWVVFYSPLEPRDNRGRWSSEGPGGPGQAGVRPNKGTWKDQAVELAATGKVLMWSLQDVVEECQRLGFDELEQHAKEQMQNPDKAQWFGELVELAPLVRKLRVHREEGQPVQQPSPRWQQSLFGYNPAEARKGKGDPEGGEWTAGGATGATATGSQPTGTIGQTGNELAPLPDGHKVLELAGHDYRELVDPQERHRTIGKYEPWSDNLKPDDLTLIDYYQQAGFDNLNPHLRSGAPSTKLMGLNPSDETGDWFTTDSAIDELQRAVLQAKAPTDMRLYRGGHAPKDMKLGDILQDDGFVSTSMSVDTAFNFASAANERLFVVDVPKDSAAAAIDAASQYGEDEVLLPHGATFAYVGDVPIHYNGGYSDTVPRFIYLGPAQRHPEMAHFKSGPNIDKHSGHGDPSRFIWQEGDLRIIGTVTGETVRFAYNPEEPRDWHGRWTGASGRMTPRSGPAHSTNRVMTREVDEYTGEYKGDMPNLGDVTEDIKKDHPDWFNADGTSTKEHQSEVMAAMLAAFEPPDTRPSVKYVAVADEQPFYPMMLEPTPETTPDGRPVPPLPQNFGAGLTVRYVNKWIRESLGIRVSALENPNIANYAAPLLRHMYAMGMPMPEHLAENNDIPDAVASYSAAGDTLFFNRKSDFWVRNEAGRKQMMARQAETRFLATGDDRHIVTHELAHEATFKYWDQIGVDGFRMMDQKFVGPEQAIAHSVSRYAGTLPIEFLAETFAGMAFGKKYGPEVMALYNKFHGPPMTWRAERAAFAYNPSEARNPKGSAGGGEWTSGGPSAALEPFTGTPEEGEAILTGLGVWHPNLKGAPLAARIIVPVYRYLAAVGLPLPKRLGPSSSTWLGDAIAAYVPATDTLQYNADHYYWADAESNARARKRNSETGWFVSGHEAETVLHEIGHEVAEKQGAKLYQYGPNQWPKGVGANVAMRVSRYAATRPHEFVAETFAGLVLGNTYDDEVMALYKKRGGVIPPALEKLETRGAFDWGEAPTSAPTRHRPNAEPKAAEPVSLLQTPLPATTPDGKPVPALPDDITNPKKVEDWLENELGLTRAVLGSPGTGGARGGLNETIGPKVAAYVAPIMQRLYAQGFQMPRSIYLTTQYEMDDNVMAWYDPTDDSLNLNAIAKFWGETPEQRKMFYLFQGPNGSKVWSAQSPEHAVIHELAHFLHNEHIKEVGPEKADERWSAWLKEHDIDYDDKFERTLMKVSRYASTSPHEFVAETFAGLYTGHKYPKDVMDIYEALAGPPLPKPATKAPATFYMDIVRIPMEVAA